MHKAIRNITRLLERIQDFEKRVIQRRGQLDRADAEAQIAALVLLARTLVPFAPHVAEELLVAAGVGDDPAALGLWPESAEIPVSPAATPAS
jgi:leucyl-tRNA synthetase